MLHYEPRMNEADVPAMLDVVRETPPEVETLLLVGHNPGLEDLVLTLAGDGLDDSLERLRAKFPTSAVAVLAWRGTGWAALAPGVALLTWFTVPRGRTHA